MPTYVALLRGISPGNPNMHGAKLCEAFAKMGFDNVSSVISSGNVIFDSPSRAPGALEKKIEKALPEQLGFSSTAIIRSREELEDMLRKKPFKNKKHSRESYLLVSFLKDRTRAPGGSIFTVVDLEHVRTPEIMSRIEKTYDKAVTSRTWNTVERIVKKMEKS